jgi:hypothetical protein
MKMTGVMSSDELTGLPVNHQQQVANLLRNYQLQNTVTPRYIDAMLPHAVPSAVTASLIVLQLPQVQTTELHKGTDV